MVIGLGKKTFRSNGQVTCAADLLWHNSFGEYSSLPHSRPKMVARKVGKPVAPADAQRCSLLQRFLPRKLCRQAQKASPAHPNSALQACCASYPNPRSRGGTSDPG